MKLAAAVSACALGAVLAGPPAGAASSPPPRVQIGQLTGPETGPEGAPQYWLEVTAADRDGIVNEITVQVSGDNYNGIVFADRPCFMFPPAQPGDPVTMRIPLSLPGPGSYRVRVHADSTPFCGSPQTQEGPEKQRRFRVTG